MNEKSLQMEQKGKDKKEKGASLVEYALLVALIAVVAIVAIQTLGKGVSTKLSSVASAVVG
ncbi:MAG: Flp family type IVb pilin [Bdellovibrionales bacterium]|nr:Flp family type IVb pilin [Bdellovibrionales bacterium]